jgi:rhomboid family GlyGly-CTERM serine protease
MRFRLPILSLLVAAAATCVQALPEFVSSILQFDRGAIAVGQWWRVVTGHLTHFDANHLAWDIGALVALGLVCESISRRAVAVALGSSMLAISAAVWAFQPQFEIYRGLSGLDCALFGLFATSLLQERRTAPVLLGAFALLGVGAKCVFELGTGSTAFASGDGYAPVPLAHLVGALCGIASASMPSSNSSILGLRSLAADHSA